MNFTFTIQSWMIPTIITLLSIGTTLLVMFLERNDRGWFSGLYSIIMFFITCVITIVAWLVWGLTTYMK